MAMAMGGTGTPPAMVNDSRSDQTRSGLLAAFSSALSLLTNHDSSK